MKRIAAALGLALFAFPALAADIIRAWPPLNPRERASLADVLKKSDKARIVIACGSVYCSKLAAGVEKAFETAGWKVSKVHHGGLGIDGVTGLRLTGCGMSPHALAIALQKITARNVQTIAEPNCTPNEPELMLVIGEREF